MTRRISTAALVAVSFVVPAVAQSVEVDDVHAGGGTVRLAQQSIERWCAATDQREFDTAAETLRTAVRGTSREDLDRILSWWQPLLRSTGRREVAVDLALELHEEALERASPTSAGCFALALARRLQGLSRWRDALAVLDSCQRVLDASPTTRSRLQGRLFNRRVVVFLELGLIDVARQWLERQEEAARFARDTGDRSLWVVSQRAVHRRECNLLMARGADDRCDAQIAEWLRDQDLYPPGSVHRGVLLRYQGLARLSLARIDLHMQPLAEATLREAIGSDLDPTGLALVRLQLADLELLRGHGARTEQLIGEAEAAWNEGPEWRGVREYAAALRSVLARTARDRAAMERARTRLEQVLGSFLDDWHRMPARSGGVGFFNFTHYRRLVGELCSLTAALHPGEDGVRRAFEALLAAQAMNSLHRRLCRELDEGSATLTTERIRATLCPPGHGILTYLPAPHGSHLFLLDADSLQHIELAPEARLTADSRTLTRNLRAGSRISDAELTECVDRLLPLDARRALERWTHLTVVGSDLVDSGDLLEEVPGIDGRPLGESLAVGYASSLAVLHSLARRPVADGSSEVWWMANPSPQAFVSARFDGLRELPIGRAEMRGLFAPFAGRTVREHFGPDATQERLFDSALGRAAFLHVLGHGISDDERELSAGLVLHGDELEAAVLRCEEVAESVRAPRLVALSVCDAGRGPSRRGESEVSSLSGAFLLAGADCVVLSPYPLELEATRQVMAIFHRELAAGASPSEALRQARRERRGRSTPLRAVGLAHRPVFAPSPAAPSNPATYRVLVVLAALLAGGGLAFRYRSSRSRTRASDLTSRTR